MAKSLAHTKWMCKYHIVFTPKYRQKEGDLQPIQGEYRTNPEGLVQMERSRDHRRKSDGGPYPFARVNSAKDKCIEFHGVSEGEECVDDI